MVEVGVDRFRAKHPDLGRSGMRVVEDSRMVVMLVRNDGAAASRAVLQQVQLASHLIAKLLSRGVRRHNFVEISRENLEAKLSVLLDVDPDVALLNVAGSRAYNKRLVDQSSFQYSFGV